MSQPIRIDHGSAHSEPGCMFPDRWSEEAAVLAAAIDRRFDWDDSIGLAIGWVPGNNHALRMHMRARGLAFHMTVALTHWWLWRGGDGGPNSADRLIANAFEQLVRGALYEMKP